jgi:hypothetical protein
MYYFSAFPNITTTDYNGNSIVVKNILERVEIIPSLLNNTLLFYSYNIQDGDTPDIVAQKYYGDSYRYWLVPYANQMIDPQGDWPMGPNLFNDYLFDKYANTVATVLSVNVANVTMANVLSYTQGTIQNYIKTVSTYDSVSSNTTSVNYTIDYTLYANTTQTTSDPVFFTNSQGNTHNYVVQSISKSTQSIFDYEVAMNESKRNIQLLNTTYAGPVENQLTKLLEK